MKIKINLHTSVSLVAGLFLLLIILVSCDHRNIQPSGAIQAADPLPSWNEGAARQAILDFISTTTDTASSDFIPEPGRIVVFDNDGTLWSEKPYYFQLQFTMDRIRQLAPRHPEWKDIPPVRAVLENDLSAVMASGVPGLIQLLTLTNSGMTTEEFTPLVRNWIDTARHPGTGLLYTEMVYQPMLELLDLFRDNGFKTYIVSGGGIDFMRPWTEAVYGIPPEQVIGSSIRTKFEMIDGNPAIVRLPEIDFISDKEDKPTGINRFIGRRPVAAFGNSDGDLQMLQWTAAGEGKRLMVYIHHTDADREWAYDRDSHIGKLDLGLDEAAAKGWTIADMKKDWKVIYPGAAESQ